MHIQLEIITTLKNELSRVTTLEQQMAKDLEKLPEGFLMKRNDGRVFHVIKANGEKEIRQLNNKDSDDIKLFGELKYKRYIKAALPVLKDWIKYIKSFIQNVIVYDPLKIQEKLKIQYHGLNGMPIFLEGDINPENWESNSSPPMYEEGLIHPSQKGMMTRSKSEAQIASSYESQGWKFMYEPVVKLPDGRILRPDFAVLHPIKRKVIYMLYGVCLILLIVGLFFFSRKPKTTLETPFAVMDVLEKIKLPVVKESDTIIGRPYTENKVSIVQSYYDYKANESEQTNSIIYYQDTYIQNCGISYSNDGEPFDVVAVLDGEVIEVKQDTLLGNIIKIKHSESVMSVYQSIGDINVAVGDNVVKGTVLATSSTSNIRSTLNNHLYFELLIDGINVNPEEYYDKSL